MTEIRKAVVKEPEVDAIFAHAEIRSVLNTYELFVMMSALMKVADDELPPEKFSWAASELEAVMRKIGMASFWRVLAAVAPSVTPNRRMGDKNMFLLTIMSFATLTLMTEQKLNEAEQESE